MSSRRSRLKSVFSWAAAVTVPILVLEGALCLFHSSREAALRIQKRRSLPRYSHTRYDSELGWANTPNTKVEGVYESYGKGITVTINSAGFRGPEVVPKEGLYRIICLGDSFTFGFGVDDHETYPRALERLNSGLQTINMGQSGYGLGQMLLWFEREGLELQADLVILGFGNHSLERSLRNFQFGHAKPQFSAREGRLVVRNRPVPQSSSLRRVLGDLRFFLASLRSGRVLLNLSEWARTGVSETVSVDQKYRTAAIILDRLSSVVEESDSRLVLVHLPGGIPSIDWMLDDLEEGRRILDFLRRSPSAQSLPILDLAENFASLPPERASALFSVDRHHLSSRGNEYLARLIDEWLSGLDADYPLNAASLVGAPSAAHSTLGPVDSRQVPSTVRG